MVKGQNKVKVHDIHFLQGFYPVVEGNQVVLAWFVLKPMLIATCLLYLSIYKLVWFIVQEFFWKLSLNSLV